MLVIEALMMGFAAAIALGTSDYLARFTSRRLGAAAAVTYVILIGAVLVTAFVYLSGAEVNVTRFGLLMSAIHGVNVAAMSLMLYAALARGPISLAVPIVATHPVLVLLYDFVIGASPLSLQQGLAAALVIGGVVSASILSVHGDAKEETDRPVSGNRTRVTLMLALGSCLAYALLIISGQSASAEIGQVGATWIGRIASAAVLLLALGGGFFKLPRPGQNLLPLGVQGVLDSLGYIALLSGGLTAYPGLTAVVGSLFGFVTILLARLFIGERVGTLQWLAIGVSFLGIASLVASSS